MSKQGTLLVPREWVGPAFQAQASEVGLRSVSSTRGTLLAPVPEQFPFHCTDCLKVIL